MPVLNTVIRKGTVCLPRTLSLPDDHPVTVFYDEPAAKVEPPKSAPVAEISQRQAPVVPDLDDYPDLGEDTYEHVAPPPEIVGTVTVKFEYIGERPAPQIPDEE
jgi:hypothetical protein